MNISLNCFGIIMYISFQQMLAAQKQSIYTENTNLYTNFVYKRVNFAV